MIHGRLWVLDPAQIDRLHAGVLTILERVGLQIQGEFLLRALADAGCRVDFANTPTQESFLPTGGGYETVLTVYSNLEISAGERIKNASIELLENLKPGKVPESPKEKPAEEAWGYGSLGPDLE